MPEKVHVDLGQRVLAYAPRNLFDHDSALLAIDPPHEIEEEHQKAPDSHKLKGPWRAGLIVSGGGTMTTGANRSAPLARSDRNQDTLAVVGEMGESIDEARKVMALVKNSVNQHVVEI